MSDNASSSAGRRQTSRTLYPDLNSAYAQILGRETVGSLATPPSQGQTRFPLSPMSSSSEDSEQVEQDVFDPLPLGTEDIPLQDLSCQRVHSAQGVLQEADYHQESSAIFESSEDSRTIDPDGGRLSGTLDEIVSQYADGTADGPSAFPTLHGYDDQVLASRTTIGIQPGRDRNVHHHGHDISYDPLPPEHLTGDLSHQAPQRMVARPLENVADLLVDEGGWEPFPEGGGSGGLIPSRLRFRLAWRGTLDTSDSSLVHRSPATPWDPLSSQGCTTFQTDIPHEQRHHLHAQHQSPCEESSGSTKYQRGQTGVETMLRNAALRSSQSPTSNSEEALVKSPQTQSLPYPHQSASASSTCLTFLQTSAIPSSTLFPRNPVSILPSSSLFPLNLTSNVLSNSSSQEGLERARESTMPQLYIDKRERTRSQGQEITDVGLYPLEKDISCSTCPCRQSDPPEVGDTFDGHVGRNPVSCIGTADDAAEVAGRTLEQKRLSHRPGKVTPTEETRKRALVQHLSEGGYEPDETEISRFMRNTRHFRADRKPSHLPEAAIPVDSRRRVRSTGSSLANYSTDSLSLNRMGCGGESSSSWTSLSNNNEVQGNRNSAHNTSASLLPADWPRGLDNLRLSICTDHCPTFPLTAQQLRVTRLPSIGRIPFERLQLLENGAWLEKAWCFVHGRVEFSHAALAEKRSGAVAGSVDIQRQAGRVLLVACIATFWVGGFILAHDMGKAGALSSRAMGEMTRRLSGREDAAAARVHPVDARLARAVERVGFLVAVVVLLACIGVLVWAATT